MTCDWAFLTGLWAIAILACGCDSATTPSQLTVHQQLVELASTLTEGEPDAPEPTRVLTPERAPGDAARFERIGNEARPVLRGFPLVRLKRRSGLPLETDPQVLSASFPLPAEFGPYTSGLVIAGALIDGAWSFSPPRQTRITRVADEQRVEARFPIERFTSPGRNPIGAFWLRAQVRALPEGRLRRIETAPLLVPANARLDLGFGILAQARQHGVVGFALSACIDANCTPLLEETLDPEQPGAREWNDRTLSLAALAGREVVFRFETLHVGEGAFSLPVWSDPLLLAPDSGGQAPRNLVLISLDTLRADRLPSYRYSRNTAPFIEERLARQGVVFERAFSAASTTGPSHMTAFTARTPSGHGLLDNIVEARLSPGIPTLAEHLRAAGFATGAVTEDGALAFGSGIERGFESYLEFHPASNEAHHAEDTFAAGRAWIDRHRDRRFLLFLQTYETHTPYRAPEGTPPLEGPPALLAGEHAGLQLRKDWRPDAYDHEIRYVDEALRGFVEGLELAGILDDTLLVLFSDHGEAFLEHGYLHHGGGIHDEVLHVPLIFTGPGAVSGQRVSAPVGLVDLLPTLLELMGLPAAAPAMGRSFASLVRGEAPDPSWSERPIFSETWAPRRVELVEGRIRKTERRPPSLAVRRGTRKLIREPGPDGDRYSYFDLASDPGEQRDLYASDPESAADLRTLLDDYARLDPPPSHLDASANDATRNPLDTLDPERQQALRALGYLE